ncbi:Transglutaminase-like superfamily protein [Paenibacillaceae bacterium GAS479]|nr:Transglutaminase-like superfamily protein [Paenibacillaceae bacterium GAS479]
MGLNKKATTRAVLAVLLASSLVFPAPGQIHAASSEVSTTTAIVAATDQAKLYAPGSTHNASSYGEIANIVFNVMSNNYGDRVTINFKGDTSGIDKKLQQVFKDVGSKNDYMRFVLKKMNWSWTSTASEATIEYGMTYWETPEQSEAVRQEARKALTDKTIFGKQGKEHLQAIYEWVIGRLRYDSSLDDHSAYAGLFGPNGTVCQGYALLLQRMLEEAGYENRMIYGSAKGDLHIWNMVKLNGTWLHLDTTLDDPGAGRSKLTYFLKSDAVIEKDHIWDRTAYPRSGTELKAAGIRSLKL